MTIRFYVSPQGNDSWSGRRPEPWSDGDGPFATIGRARDALRKLRSLGGRREAAEVLLRGGRYHVAEPLRFEPQDGNAAYIAYPGEQPVVDGGRSISGWRSEIVNGQPCWVVELPEVADGSWYFRQLWVNGERRARVRVPKQGYYWIEDVPGTTLAVSQFLGSDTFQCASEDIELWHNLTDVEVIALHWWVEERMPIVSFDPHTRLVRSSRRSIFALKDDVAERFARYYVENVFEELRDAGEWYLDRVAGKLYYLPMPGETFATAEVYAPCIEQLLRVEGQPDDGQLVTELRFEGLAFEHTEWCQPTGRSALFAQLKNWSASRDEPIEFAATPQAASDVPGALRFEGARSCAIRGCEVRHIGGYAIELADGCGDITLAGNHLYDLGAGGVRLNGADAQGERVRRTGDNTISDNHIHTAGRVFLSAVGIFAAHTFGNRISHNHIHDLFYSGISCGWVWGYGENVARDNLLAYNHIHHLGHGQLSDMGGIYTLGVQPGTVIRGNLIHNIEKHNYGGWAIYLDEGSSHILVEGNVCHTTSSQLFHQHFGRENIVRNNVFAFGREGLIALGRAEDHTSFTFSGNIVIGDAQPLYAGGYAGQVERRGMRSDLNLLWDLGQAPLVSGDAVADADGKWTLARSYTLEQWRELGYDRHSLIADPRCRNLEQHDYSPAPDSPAWQLGWQVIDLARVGPREAARFEPPDATNSRA